MDDLKVEERSKKLLQARIAIGRRNLENALEVLEDLLKRNNEDHVALGLKAHTLELNGELDGSKKIFEQLNSIKLKENCLSEEKFWLQKTKTQGSKVESKEVENSKNLIENVSTKNKPTQRQLIFKAPKLVEWTQSDSNVYVVINRNAEDLKFKCERSQFFIFISNSVQGDLNLEFKNLPAIQEEKSFAKKFGQKVQITLSKIDTGPWPSDALLAPDCESYAAPINSQNDVSKPPKIKSLDQWLDKELEDSAKDATDMMRQIYESLDAEGKKAMNKSYSESGGTVLSTDWSNVKNKDFAKETKDQNFKN
eukprot:GHVP01031246.1.p1 GENE.GHVP01031246.1~~GHVP01031246.1.p1  ORF type:complete len:338 (+),score=75.50 GHVP01031246.1:90-1016(+)